MKILIAGGGITGLTTALALHDRGFTVQVYEAAPALSPLGVGINLLPHSVRILTDLGLQGALLSRGVATRELVYFNVHGQRIWGEPRGRWAGYEWPQISLHRGVLQMTLLDAVKERLGVGAIVTDRKLTRYEQDETGVTLHLVNAAGEAFDERGDVLIACDGIHSTVRKLLYPQQGSPTYGGRVLWRGVTMAKPFLTGATMIMAGYQDQKFVCYPIEAVDEREMLQPTSAEGARPVTLLNAGFRADAGNPALTGPVPALGADTDAVLAAAGYSEDEIAALRAEKAI